MYKRQVVYIDNIAKQIPLKAEEIRQLSTEDRKTQLNAEIIKCLNAQAEKKYEDNWNKFLESEGNRLDREKGMVTEQMNDVDKFLIEVDEEKPFLYRSNYVEIQRALADYLLNIHFKPLEVNPKKEKGDNLDKEFDEVLVNL